MIYASLVNWVFSSAKTPISHGIALKEVQLDRFDFSSNLNIVRANMLYIEKFDLSYNAVNRIKRLAAFKNPDFYKSQAMRMSTYDKPRIISTAEDSESYIGIPRGCENKLIELLEKHNVIYNIDDKTNAGQNIKVNFTGVMREEQVPAAKALLEHNIGVLSATTAFGKTVIGAYLIAERKVNILVLVHTQALLIQWKKSLDQFLDLEYAPPELLKIQGRKKVWSATGMLGAGKNNLSGIVDIAVMQSLVSGDEVKELVRKYGMIIVDECHHVSAVNFEKILKYATARYIYGLSATPTRQDGHHPIIFMQCGEIRYKVDAKEQAEKRAFEHYIIPRFTTLSGVSLKDEKNIVQVYRDLAGNELRNRMITTDIISSIENGRSPIVLTERTEHVAHIADLLYGKCKHIISLTGTMSVKEKRETMIALNVVPPDEPLIIIATGKYVGEGFDLPRLDTLFLALPIAWKGKVAQYAGRLHRNYEGKEEVQIYDYVDVHIPVLERMYHKRVKSYANIGYKTKSLEQSIEKSNIIYNGKSFLSVYNIDIIAAKKEIIIVSPFMRKNRLSQMIKVLSKAVINGVAVTVITRSPDDFKEADKYTTIQNTEYLTQANIKVIHKSGFHQKFTVIDGSIIWYGSVNFLSFGSNEESIMRLESFDIANELLDIL
ncbi:MAG: DEAD/DEAH box helicase family protein [Eubacteriales bacterium]